MEEDVGNGGSCAGDGVKDIGVEGGVSLGGWVIWVDGS